MKVSRILVILGAIFASAAALYLLLTKQHTEALTASGPPATQTLAQIQVQSGGSKSAVGTNPLLSKSTSSSLGFRLSSLLGRWQTKDQQMRSELGKWNDAPIVFFGKILDQSNNPVAGVEVVGSILVRNGATERMNTISAVSNERGLFSFDGGRGESLGVMARKAGYTMNATNAVFKYSYLYPEVRHVPDSNNPVVIGMWKLQGSDRLVHFEITTFVRTDGTPDHFDLQVGKRVESGGDLVIQIQSPLKPNAIQKYDWRATIHVLNGGLIQSSDIEFEKMFLAPESGYEADFIIDYRKEVQQWSSRFNSIFYFAGRDGKIYGKLGLAITTDFVRNESVPVTISGYLNPGGSRNLEVEPALVTETKPQG